MKHKTIVCVDDYEPFLQLLRVHLEALTYEVITTSSPKRALVLATTGRDIGLLITDFTMPEMSGGELIVEVRKWRPLLPIILLSRAWDGEPDPPLLGANLFVHKRNWQLVLPEYVQQLVQEGINYGT